MTLAEYIKALEEIKADYGDKIPVKVQTLTHRWEAEKPVIRVGVDDVLFVLINP